MPATLGVRFVYLGNKVRHSCSVWRIWHSSDPSLDSWPLDKNGIEEIIATGEFSKISGAVDEDAEDGPQNLRGFHTAEKMLFLDGEPRDLETSRSQRMNWSI